MAYGVFSTMHVFLDIQRNICWMSTFGMRISLDDETIWALFVKFSTVLNYNKMVYEYDNMYVCTYMYE